MPLVATLAGERVVSTELDGEERESLKRRYRTGEPLLMSCGRQGKASVSTLGLQFFAHKTGTKCGMHEGGETPEHLELKSLLVDAARAAGWEAELGTEEMLELGYAAFFVPGGGIVVNNPDTHPVVARQRITSELYRAFGTFVPKHLNSWDEYASQVPNLDRVFAFANVERHEKEKQAIVAGLVNDWLVTRAGAANTIGTARADELAAGDVLEAVDVRWWSHSPAHVVYTVAAIEPAEGGKLTVSFTSANDRDRTLTVPSDRRFLKAS